MNDGMMAKPKQEVKLLNPGGSEEVSLLNPEKLKQLGLPADASFGDAIGAAFIRGLETLESFKTPAELEAYGNEAIARLAAIEGKTPEEMRAELESVMKMPEEELLVKVMQGPYGELIKKDLAKMDRQDQKSSGAQ